MRSSGQEQQFDGLQSVEAAFAEGRDRPLRPTYASSGRQYSDLLQETLRQRLSPEERSLFEVCMTHQERALQAARHDRLERARREFEEARSPLQEEVLSIEGRLLIQALLEPAEAYLYYKRDDSARARELLFHASRLDQRLVAEFGYNLMSAHRLQIGHNLLRIHARKGERAAAVRLGVAFLDYLELRADALPETLVCDRDVLDAVPKTIHTYYFDKICAEIALLLAGGSDGCAQQQFHRLAHHATPRGCLDADFGVHAHAWVASKHLALAGEVQTFLDVATDLLRKGRQAEPALWFATIMDVVDVCRSLGPAGKSLAEQMAGEAATFEDAPWRMKQVVDAD